MSKIAAVHQPQYLPWLPFIDKAARADVFIQLDCVQFHRGGVQNRNTIKIHSGPHILTVPVRVEHDTLIRDVRIAYSGWTRKHVRTIRQAYARAPYLSLFEEGLRPILERPWTFLVDLNRAVTAWLLEQFHVRCECVLASELGCNGLRDDLVVDLCRAVGATIYLSGQGARAYQDTAKFRERGLELRYQRYLQPCYPQLHRDLGFLPDLSALDLLLNVGPQAPEVLRSGQQEFE